MPLSEILANWTFAFGMATTGRRAHRRLLAAAADPAAAQQRALATILDIMAATELGRTHGIDRFMDANSFRRAVPVHDYEALRPHIDRQIATGAPVVAAVRPVMYARTSGTTGKPKLIPVTPEVVHGLREAQRAFAYVQHQAFDAFRGRVLAIGGALREETLPDGTPAGSTTGLIYETMPRIIRAKYAMPAEVFAIEDYDLRYQVIARIAAQCQDLSVIATANPSTLLRLLHQIEVDLVPLTEDMAVGSSRHLARVPNRLAGPIAAALRRNAAQAQALQECKERGQALTFGDVWPDLRAVMTWLGGSCAVAAAAVRQLLPPDARMIDAGYVASEVRGTVVLDAERNLALPMLEDVYFEFAPVDAWNAGVRDTLLLHEITQEQAYYVLVTTRGGLLRYHMNDIVRVTGMIGRTPTLAFVRKGRGVTNITGEKLSEDQVNLAVAEVMGAAGIRVPFYVVVADVAESCYRAFVEAADTAPDRLAALAGPIDRKLAGLNIEYESKRGSGRLKPLRIVALTAGAESAYRRHCIGKGQREAQFKVLTLQEAAEFDFDIFPYLAG